MGRPTDREVWNRHIAEGHSKQTPETVQKLKEAFSIGATVAQACMHAEISERTYYYWVENNPKLLQEFQAMRQKLPLKAKWNIAERIHGRFTEGDIPLSKWLVERIEPEQYGETMKVEHSGEIKGTTDEDKAAIAAFHARLKANIRRRTLEKARKEGESV